MSPASPGGMLLGLVCSPTGSQREECTLNLLKSPPGTLQWPTHLDAPLRVKQVTTSIYEATVRFSPDEAAPLIAFIDTEIEKAFAAARVNPRYAKTDLHARRPPCGRSTDTAWVKFEAQEPSLLFDVRGNRITEKRRVDLGALVRVGYAVVPFAGVRETLYGTDPRYFVEGTDGIEIGVSLHLVAVQFLDRPHITPVSVPLASGDRPRRPLLNLPTE